MRLNLMWTLSADGTDVFIGGVMQHIEEAGIHSGDSACVLPPYAVTPQQLQTLMQYTRRLALALHVVGLVNIQYAMQDGVIYVLEVNPRASRTVPFVSKSTGIPLAKVAAKLMIGRTLKDLDIKGYGWAKHVVGEGIGLPVLQIPAVRVISLGRKCVPRGRLWVFRTASGFPLRRPRWPRAARCRRRERCSSV